MLRFPSGLPLSRRHFRTAVSSNAPHRRLGCVRAVCVCVCEVRSPAASFTLLLRHLIGHHHRQERKLEGTKTFFFPSLRVASKSWGVKTVSIGKQLWRLISCTPRVPQNIVETHTDTLRICEFFRPSAETKENGKLYPFWTNDGKVLLCGGAKADGWKDIPFIHTQCARASYTRAHIDEKTGFVPSSLSLSLCRFLSCARRQHNTSFIKQKWQPCQPLSR